MALFEDLFSSARGPGVIGLLLGAIVLAGFCFLGMAVFDGRLNGDWATSANKKIQTQGSRIVALQGEVKLLEEKLEEASQEKAARSRAVRMVGEFETTKAEVVDLERQVEGAREALAEAESELDAYKQQYRTVTRARAEGEGIVELRALDGRVFQGVKILSVDDLEMRISHRDGLTTVAWDQLPVELQDRFQFDPALAKQAEERQQQRKELLDAQMADDGLRKKIRLQASVVRSKEFEIEKRRKELARNLEAMARNEGLERDYLEKAADAEANHRRALAAGRRSSHMVTAKRAEADAERVARSSEQLRIRNIEIENEIENLEADIRAAKDEAASLEEELNDQQAQRKEEISESERD